MDIHRITRQLLTDTTKKLDHGAERYPMCNDQPAQIDCRITSCVFYKDAECLNVVPAITLNPNGSFVCWSRKDE